MKKTVELPPHLERARLISRTVCFVGLYYLLLSALFGDGQFLPRMLVALPVSVAVGIWGAWPLLFRHPYKGFVVHACASVFIALLTCGFALLDSADGGTPFVQAATELILPFIAFICVLVFPALLAYALFQKKIPLAILLALFVPLIRSISVFLPNMRI